VELPEMAALSVSASIDETRDAKSDIEVGHEIAIVTRAA